MNYDQMGNINLAIIEDEPLVLQSLEELFLSTAGIRVISTATTVESFLEEQNLPRIDLVLLDIGLKDGMSGLEGIRYIKQHCPDADIVMLTTFEESDHIFKALCAGASGYLTKRTPFPKILEAVHTVFRGGSYMSPMIAKKVVEYFAPTRQDNTPLSPRQHQIVEAILEGLSYKMIADKLLISQETVKDHIKKIYRKLEIHSKSELILWKMRNDKKSKQE